MTWAWLTGDVNYVDYGGKWYRRIGQTRFHVIEILNWNEHVAEPEHTYNVDLSEVRLEGREQLEGALSFVGWEPDDDEIPPILLCIEALHALGSKAHLGNWDGSNYQKLLRTAKAESKRLDDPEAYETAMNRPVNAIGSTARELQQGDIRSAIDRGVEKGDDRAIIMAALGVR